MNKRLGEYRIVTNGLKYRVEAFCLCGFWFWKKEKWIPICKTIHLTHFTAYRPLELNTREEAQELMGRVMARHSAADRGWSAVEFAQK